MYEENDKIKEEDKAPTIQIETDILPRRVDEHGYTIHKSPCNLFKTTEKG